VAPDTRVNAAKVGIPEVQEEIYQKVTCLVILSFRKKKKKEKTYLAIIFLVLHFLCSVNKIIFMHIFNLTGNYCLFIFIFFQITV